MLTHEEIIDFVVDAGHEYWPAGQGYLRQLPIPDSGSETSIETVYVPVPEWGLTHIEQSPPSILVERSFIVDGEGPLWERCDWWSAAFSYMNGLAERRLEAENGPAHSYAQRLSGFDGARFDRAWVNWIFMFLRRWAARIEGRDEIELFGPRPLPRIVLTHDVDALSKSLPLRIKQCVFEGINLLRSFLLGRFSDALHSGLQMVRFAIFSGNYNQIGALMDIEESHSCRSIFFFHGGAGQRASFRKWLFDPGYDTSDAEVGASISVLKDGGWQIGVHPGYETFSSALGIAAEREKIEAVILEKVKCCRQHWLRFSWSLTWDAQEEASLQEDHTLGFNDRPGFRISSALCFSPWSGPGQKRHSIRIVPFMLMDAHLFLYGMLPVKERRRAIDRYVDEIAAVGGVVGVIWHQRVLHSDYGWGDDYKYLLRKMAETGVKGVASPDAA